MDLRSFRGSTPLKTLDTSRETRGPPRRNESQGFRKGHVTSFKKTCVSPEKTPREERLLHGK